MPAGALDGIRVIDLTMNVLGPFAGQLLGDAGADVIKVESATGDPTRYIGPAHSRGMSAYFLNLNRNKRSLVLDLKSAAGRAAMLRLVETADVFLHNLRADAVARLELDYGSLREKHPRLIYAAATGFRLGGDRDGEPAFDDTIQGLSGLAAINRDATGAPRFVPFVICDKICGQALASAVFAALFHRERSGAGQLVHVPMMETTAAFMLIEHLWGATVGQPGHGYPRLLTPHRKPYATADGYLCVFASTDAQWTRLFPALGRPELAEDPRFSTLDARTKHIDTLYGILAEAVQTRPTQEWLAVLTAADIPHGPINTVADLLADPYLRAGDFFQSVPQAMGELTLMAPPTLFSATPAAIRLPPPMLGEHSAEILAELGIPA